MKNTSKKDQILAYINKKSRELISRHEIDRNGADAVNISYDLRIDRTNVSRDLNTLWKNGLLVKIAGRPVYYLSIQELNKAYPNVHIPSYIPKDETISTYLQSDSPDSSILNVETQDFSHVIGAKGSLYDEIEKAKAAVSYPPYGLHTIISGNPGTEKTNIANNMVLYAVNNGLRTRNCPYFEIDCRGYTDSFTEELFGVYDPVNPKKGIFQRSNNGFVVLEQIEYLPETIINLISSAISKNYYSRLNTNEQLELKCMVILTTDLPLDDPLINNIQKYTPIRIHLNDIDSRGIYEKYELIMDLFSKEARNIHTSIKVSKDVLVTLAGMRFRNNLSELQNLVKNICSRVFLEKVSGKMINVAIYNLPREVAELTQRDLDDDAKTYSGSIMRMIETDYVYFDETGHSDDFEKFVQFPLQSRAHLLSQFVNEFDIDINSLNSMEDYVYENINCLKNCSETYLKALRNNIDPYVFSVTTSALLYNPDYSSLASHQQLLYGIMLHITNSIRRIKSGNYHPSDSESLSDKIYRDEFLIAKEIYSNFEKKYDFKVSNREIDFLASYLAITGKYVSQTSPAVLVIAHGERTASDMVAYIRKTISGDYHLDAIDYNENMQLNDLLELACIRSSELNQGSGVLFFVDMEPLTTISEHVIRTTGIPAKTIFPLTMNGLIQIITKSISSENDMESLVLANPSTQNYHFREDDRDGFIRAVTEKIIAKTVIFIDAQKIVDILKVCLDDTLQMLRIPYSNDIAVKYLCHCSIMIERVIRKEAWDNRRLKQYLSQNHRLLDTVEQGLEYAVSSLDIKIPQTELVYVAEMFEPYIQ